MKSRSVSCILALAAFGVHGASAVPSLTSLGGGVPVGVTNNLSGTYYIGGSGFVTTAAARWTLTGGSLVGTEVGGTGNGSAGYISNGNGLFVTGSMLNVGPQVLGNTASSVSPAFNPNPTLVVATNQPASTESRGARWSAASNSWQLLGGLPIVPSLIAYGSSSNGSSTGSFLTPNGISSTGQYLVGLGYVCTYNTAGTAVSASTFRWRPWIWDANGNGGLGAMTVLPTPFKTTSGQTSLRRTGNAYAVSTDGLVVAGATEHNTSVTPGLDVDGGRLVVWRWDAGTSAYIMSYLDTGVDGSGFPKYMSSTPSSMCMNQAGTIIAARGPDGITKWIWNGTTWGAPIVIGNAVETPATWLPAAVTSCGVPPTLGGSICMSEDGNTIAGSAVYSTCGSFMTGGFIWHSSDNTIRDWYDYNVSLGTPGCSTGGFFGPIGDNGDPSRGLPVLGSPNAISPDGSAMVGFQGGTQRIPGAPSWIWQADGGSCTGATITSNPAATTNFNACTSAVILNVSASGTPPFTYQWSKNGVPVFDGATGFGSNITGANSFQFRITPPTGYTLSPSEAGTYSCTVTASCGTSVTTTNAVVQVDSAYPVAANDVCSGATVVAQGSNVLSPAQTPCGSYNPDPISSAGCAVTKADLWYSFTPGSSGDYRIETCGANYDTVLSVFDGCGGSELNCNNDNDPNTGPTCSGTRSRVIVTLTGGQNYRIRCAANGNAFLTAGSSTLNLSINPAPVVPANDECFSAVPAALNVAIPFNTTEARPSSLNALSCAASANLSRDVWYTYTAPRNGKLTASTCPQGVASGGYSLMANTVLAFYDGPCGNVLSCNDNMPTTAGCGSQLSKISDYVMTTGQQIYIRVSGSSATTFGQGQLSLSLSCPADFNHDNVVDFFDYLDFVDAFSANAAIADFNGDAAIDFFDYLDFVDALSIGCN